MDKLRKIFKTLAHDWGNSITGESDLDCIIKAEKQILKHYISYDDVYNLLQSVQGLTPKHYMQLLENFKKYERKLKGLK